MKNLTYVCIVLISIFAFSTIFGINAKGEIYPTKLRPASTYTYDAVILEEPTVNNNYRITLNSYQND